MDPVRGYERRFPGPISRNFFLDTSTGYLTSIRRSSSVFFGASFGRSDAKKTPKSPFKFGSGQKILVFALVWCLSPGHPPMNNANPKCILFGQLLDQNFLSTHPDCIKFGFFVQNKVYLIFFCTNVGLTKVHILLKIH